MQIGNDPSGRQLLTPRIIGEFAEDVIDSIEEILIEEETGMLDNHNLEIKLGFRINSVYNMLKETEGLNKAGLFNLYEQTTNLIPNFITRSELIAQEKEKYKPIIQKHTFYALIASIPLIYLGREALELFQEGKFFLDEFLSNPQHYIASGGFISLIFTAAVYRFKSGGIANFFGTDPITDGLPPNERTKYNNFREAAKKLIVEAYETYQNAKT